MSPAVPISLTVEFATSSTSRSVAVTDIESKGITKQAIKDSLRWFQYNSKVVSGAEKMMLFLVALKL